MTVGSALVGEVATTALALTYPNDRLNAGPCAPCLFLETGYFRII
jgi:hypothetical protein